MVASPNSTWNLPPPTGFQPFRDDLPVTWYEQEMPHLRQDGATYFVTFRLNDSLPESKLRELRHFRSEWSLKNPKPRSQAIIEAYTFDRIIRDAEHLYRVVQYIGRNPRKANLAPDRFQLWIRPSWIEQGWNFELSS